MKYLRFSSRLLLFAVFTLPLSAQTNTFPSSGSVGIGTTTPSAPLHVKLAAAGVQDALYLQAGGNGGGDIPSLVWLAASGAETARIFQTGAGNGFRFLSAGPILFNTGITGITGTNERMVIATTGNLGIGTGSPGSKVTINGPGTDKIGISLGNADAGITTSRYLGITRSDVPTDLGANSGFSGLEFGGPASAGEGYLAFHTHDYGVASGERMRIDKSGNVGIGTTSPLSKLHVMGVGRFGLNDAGTNNMGGILVASGTGVGGARQYWIGASNPTSHNNNMFEISDYDGTTNTPLMTIYGTHAGSAAGNVGIGTTNPTQKLSVNGTIQAKEVIVQTGWSDYVFEKNYRLAPLSEVERAIEKDGHLPGIPSAKEVAERGVNMGEMQSKLLAKVEELTLHVIRQEKEIQLLRDRLNSAAR